MPCRLPPPVATHVVDHKGNRYFANGCALSENVALIWGATPPQWRMAGAAHPHIFMNGTAVWNHSDVHFTLGDLTANGVHLSSWALLHGPK